MGRGRRRRGVGFDRRVGSGTFVGLGKPCAWGFLSAARPEKSGGVGHWVTPAGDE